VVSNEDDPDLEWLLSHMPVAGAPSLHEGRVARVCDLLRTFIAADRLPLTVGLFGGWGSGKTTLLSLLAQTLANPEWKSCKIVYFNAWKYAGFMEIVPSLIYKILRHGNYDHKRVGADLIAEIMTSIGKEYADKIGDWVAKFVGINPVEVLADAKRIQSAIKAGEGTVPEEVVRAYYTQIDRAQDLLLTVFKDNKKITIVLIDELDRCDPDEAFAVIKQLRILFAMRKLPIIFVMAANPDPIGQAIKHRHGLQSRTGDFEARRILEKFVDLYIDISEPLAIGNYVRWLWQEQAERPGNVKGKTIDESATLIGLDREFLLYNTRHPTRETALAAMTTEVPMYGNLRLLQKSLDNVSARPFPNRSLVWSAWHLEIIGQMEPALRSLAGSRSSG
jgi:hypothetical protein